MRTLLVTLTTCLFVLPAYGKYSGGSGTAQDPYQIASAADLMLLGETTADYGKHFILTADLDLDPNLPGRKVFDKAVIAPDVEDSAGDYQGIPFSGLFNGDGHTVSRLTITGADYLGLFGGLGSGAEVKNLGVVDVEITSSGYSVGGLVGYNSGTLSRCYSTSMVRGGHCVGGLVGSNGLGRSSGGPVTLCYSIGVVSGTESVGGLVGQNGGDVIRCYSTSVVTGASEVGGLVGQNGGSIRLTAVAGHVADCYSTSTVSGTESVGGLVGANGGELTRCYSTGDVRGPSVGGLVGCGSLYLGLGSVFTLYGTVTASFWDIQTSGQGKSVGGIGKTTAEMKTAKTFLDAGWDFIRETANGRDDIWKISEGLSYPRLSWEKYSGGTGEPNDPYQIATATDLIALGETPKDYDKHFILIADIDLDPKLPGRKVFDKAVVAPDANDRNSWFDGVSFGGVFDGNGHTISHLTISGKDYVGLFGVASGEVKNLGMVDVSITGSGACAGGLMGQSSRTVIQCSCTGKVSGGSLVGGLVGLNFGDVAGCYGGAGVIGVSEVGGLVGQNGGSRRLGAVVGHVADCYSTSTVSGTESVGGLVGANGGELTRCHSMGEVKVRGPSVGGLVGCGSLYLGLGSGFTLYGTVTGCFWDTQTSGQTTSAGGTGKTTAQMQTAKTFLDAGWDFVGETANGTEDIWWILEGKDYPRLWWEAAKK
jgi:hypothetical protein